MHGVAITQLLTTIKILGIPFDQFYRQNTNIKVVAHDTMDIAVIAMIGHKYKEIYIN